MNMKGGILLKYVFILHHYYEIETNGSFHEYIKKIGIYSTEEKAQKAIEKLKEMPGFKEYPESFSIEKYEIDEDNWTSGFGD